MKIYLFATTYDIVGDIHFFYDDITGNICSTDGYSYYATATPDGNQILNHDMFDYVLPSLIYKITKKEHHFFI
jgi:hypothetical protein